MIRFFTFAILIQSVLAPIAGAQESFIHRLYLDFTGRRPSVQELEDFRSRITDQISPTELRGIIKEILISKIKTSTYFQIRLRNYFNNLQGLSKDNGKLLPICDNSVPLCSNDSYYPFYRQFYRDKDIEDLLACKAQLPPCVTNSLQTNFRDELAMLIVKAIIEPELKQDIRSILLTTKTVMTPGMASLLVTHQQLLLRKLGLANIDLTRLQEITLKTSDEWYWVDRDPSDKGMATGEKDYLERHSGILTLPTYLLSAPSHLSRANKFYQLLQCKTLTQNPVPESNEPKLADRKPCASCHKDFEAIGSFWNYWRPKIDHAILDQEWLLDGIKRTEPSGVPAKQDGTIPIDIDNKESMHSRNYYGELHRQTGKGVRALAEIAVHQPAFSQCMAQHAWQIVMGRTMSPEELGFATVLGQRLTSEYNWNLLEVIIDTVLSRPYMLRE